MYCCKAVHLSAVDISNSSALQCLLSKSYFQTVYSQLKSSITDKIKGNKYNTVLTVPESNRKIVETRKLDNPSTHIWLLISRNILIHRYAFGALLHWIVLVPISIYIYVISRLQKKLAAFGLVWFMEFQKFVSVL